MRTLLILGVLVVCVLLVTPSNGDRTESQDGGGEKGTSDLREFIGQNEDRKANRINAGSSLAISQRVLLRPRRQEPASPSNPNKGKRCPGCFSALNFDDPIKVPKRSRRQEKKQEPASPSNPNKGKRCPGCFSELNFDDPIKLDVSKHIQRQERKTKRDKKPKPSRKPRLRGTDGLEGKPKSDRPSRRKPDNSEPHLPNMYGVGSAPGPDFSTLEKPPKGEGRRERKKNGRKRSREEKEEKKRRKHRHHHHHHHHHHPKGVKDERKRERIGSRSPITMTYGGRKHDQDDGKEVAERMKRQSGKGKKRKDQKKDIWRVGSTSPIDSFPG